MILVNGKPLNVTLFPDGTSQVWKVSQLDIPDTNWVHVTWNFDHEGEFMHLAQLKLLIDSKGFGCVINGDEKQIYKDPKTDDGIKKSQKGRVAVVKVGKDIVFKDELQLIDVVDNNLLREVYRDGKLLVDETFADIRARIASNE